MPVVAIMKGLSDDDCDDNKDKRARSEGVKLSLGMGK